MKQVKFMLVGLMMIGATSFISAQSKVGHINTQELIQAMPEMKTALQQVENLAKSYESDIQQKLASYQAKVQQYDAESASQTNETNEARMKEVEQLQKDLGKFRDDATADIAKKREDLIKPLYDKARAAVEKVASAQGLDYVLDSSQGGGVIVHQGKDLMAEVKAELGF